jgi:hypothetical protein
MAIPVLLEALDEVPPPEPLLAALVEPEALVAPDT